MFHQTLDRAEAGDQVGALLRGIKRDDVRRGHVLAKPGTVSMHNHFAAQVVQLVSLCCDVTENKFYTVLMSILSEYTVPDGFDYGD